MRNVLVIAMFFLLTTSAANAQSKVFKEVSDEISSKIKTIYQDESLVGYLVFTKLEKVSDDSFNYKISIMDENLNDIGKVEFKEQNIDLQSVSFDQDILCLGYFKSVTKKDVNAKKNRNTGKMEYSVQTQFLNLEGKILKTNTIVAQADYNPSNLNFKFEYVKDKMVNYGELKHNIQIKNIPQKGFALFYGDKDKNRLIIYDSKGKQLWNKTIKDAEGGFLMLASNAGIYLLSKEKVEKTPEGGFEVQGYGFADSAAYAKVVLKDKQGNYLKVLTFANDPTTGKPYLAGNIINPKMSEKYIKARHIAKGAYSGVFSINLDGAAKSDIKESYSYWGDGSMNPTISPKGFYEENKAYAKYYDAFRDYQGNTFFIGSSFIKRARVGSIISATLLSWTIMFPVMILAVPGTSKVKITDAMVLKQNPQGRISVDNTVKCNRSNFFISKLALAWGGNRSFYTANNSESKTNYVIVDDEKDIFIYNVNTKKVVRTVPHKDGKISTNIFPAKEGHIMVAEYNKKEKYSKYSIEAL